MPKVGKVHQHQEILALQIGCYWADRVTYIDYCICGATRESEVKVNGGCCVGLWKKGKNPSQQRKCVERLAEIARSCVIIDKRSD